MEEDMAYALFLQEQFDSEQSSDRKENCRPSNPSTSIQSIVDDSWELIDPLPDIRELFLQFNDAYFQGKLAGIEVKWSPRMTLCAGLCCYEGRGGLCSIRLSQPLLKLRPRRDLVQTLLHEMIHALLFVTHNNRDHDAHGPEFHKHMKRINKETGANITVYHNFHDEVNVYRQHWWKCNGPCQKRPPYYGIVRRAMNRAPSSRDTWWAEHQRTCGGSYTKIKEPDGYAKKKTTKKDKKGENTDTKSNGVATLPKFFEAGKKGGSNSKSMEAAKGDNETSVSSETSQERPNGDGNMGIVPFSGMGHVLGTETAHREVSDESKLHCSSQETTEQPNRSAHKSPVEPPTRAIKNPSPRKRKRLDSTPELTIIDAFKRGSGKGQTVGTSSSTSSPVLGSHGKPIDILDNSPHRLQMSVFCKEQVPCPVCGTRVPGAQINQHLDSCIG